VQARGAKPMEPIRRIAEVNELERRVAFSEGCAFVDLYGAMGGAGSFARFIHGGLVADDLVHPKGGGLDLLGHMLTEAVFHGWERTPPRPGDKHALEVAWTTLRSGQPSRPTAPGEEAPRLALLATEGHPVAEGLRAGLEAARTLVPPEQAERLLVASAGAPEEKDLQQALAAARAARPQAECLWLALTPEARPAEGCKPLDVKVGPEVPRPALAQLGWVDEKAGGWTRRGGLGTAALVLAALVNETPAPTTTANEAAR